MKELKIKRPTRKRKLTKKPYHIYHNGKKLGLNDYLLFGDGTKYEVVFHFELKQNDTLTMDYGEGYGIDRNERARINDFNNSYLG